MRHAMAAEGAFWSHDLVRDSLVGGLRDNVAMSDERPATYFASADDWRSWLEQHHDSETELWVGFWKSHTRRPTITWPQSVDHALCVGWIDGLRQKVDENRYRIRFTRESPPASGAR